LVDTERRRIAFAQALSKMVYASPYGNVPIPADKSIWDFVEQHGSSALADAPAFICGLTARTVTFAQLLTRAKLLVAGLHTNGIRKGDVRTLATSWSDKRLLGVLMWWVLLCLCRS
jgi:hypothetical protein